MSVGKWKYFNRSYWNSIQHSKSFVCFICLHIYQIFTGCTFFYDLFVQLRNTDEEVVLLTQYSLINALCLRKCNCYSWCEEVVFRVPQGSVVGPILFNNFLNYLFLILRSSVNGSRYSQKKRIFFQPFLKIISLIESSWKHQYNVQFLVKTAAVSELLLSL